ncbi:hypothetical protein NDU88_012614 [Pleurodeles waltl]|uniref:Uncharacterized protein n=1 Tax=Pleurodeles waltl TaxID=8319 RepID=A0AAV7R0N2_PLEWA|nr:hypothetical protein NDU88_012614 [Pleurodeles waltl]
MLGTMLARLPCEDDGAALDLSVDLVSPGYLRTEMTKWLPAAAVPKDILMKVLSLSSALGFPFRNDTTSCGQA